MCWSFIVDENIVSEAARQDRELKVGRRQCIIVPPWTRQRPSTVTAQIDVADNVLLFIGGCTCVFTCARLCCVSKTLRNCRQQFRRETFLALSGICESPVTVSNNLLHSSEPDFLGERISLIIFWHTVWKIGRWKWGQWLCVNCTGNGKDSHDVWEKASLYAVCRPTITLQFVWSSVPSTQTCSTCCVTITLYTVWYKGNMSVGASLTELIYGSMQDLTHRLS